MAKKTAYKKMILHLAAVLTLTGIQQSQAQQSTTYRRLSYGITVQGTYNYRFLTSSSEGWVTSGRNYSERPVLSYAGGITVNYRLSDKFSINSGLTYMNIGFKTKKESLDWSDGSPVSEAYRVYKYNYILLPLDLKYNFYKNGVWEFYAAAGVSPAVFIGRTATVHYSTWGSWQQSKDKQSVGYNRFSLTADLQAGADYRISRKFKLTGGIFFRQFLTASNSNLDMKEHLYSAGISAGLIYTPVKRIK